MSILSMVSLDSTIAHLYQQMVANGTLDWERPNDAIYFPITMECSNSGYTGNVYNELHDRYARAWAHVLITARHRVYIAVVNDSLKLRNVNPESFVNISNHDSEWRSGMSNALTELYFTLAGEVTSVWPEDERPAPKDLQTDAMIGDWIGSEPLRFARITRGPKRKDNDYFDTLTAVEELKFKITLEAHP